MIGFTPAGRLGNWLFEFATAFAYAMKHNIDFSVPSKTMDNYWNPIYCSHLVNPEWNSDLPTIHLWEGRHDYEELPFDESWRDKNIIIEGYRQSEKYFKDYRSEILYALDFPWQQKDFISIHVRRGDYLHLQQKHILYDIAYMRKATSYFYDLGYDYFKVFSDDIAWCKEEFSKPDFGAFKIEFSNEPDELSDMIEMSCARHHICSSSTFAWWGAWLNRNPDKIVVIPELWFQPGWGNLETKDIVPETWLKFSYGENS